MLSLNPAWKLNCTGHKLLESFSPTAVYSLFKSRNESNCCQPARDDWSLVELVTRRHTRRRWILSLAHRKGLDVPKFTRDARKDRHFSFGVVRCKQ